MKLRTAVAIVPLALLAACGGDDDPPANVGNAAGKAGNAGSSAGKGGASGKAGNGGKSGASGATSGGAGGNGGKAGSSGASAGNAGASSGGSAGSGGTSGGSAGGGGASAAGKGGASAAGNAGANAGGMAGANAAGSAGANAAGNAGANAAGASGANAGSSAGGSNGGADAGGSNAGGSAGAGTAGNASAGAGGSDAGAGGSDGGANAGGNAGTNAGGSAGTNAGGTAGTNAGGSGGSGADPLSALNDEFSSASTASAWTDLFPAKHSTLDIDTLRDGFLTMVPVAQNFTGWYSEYQGPLYFKNVTGNFVVETSITLGTASDRTVMPTLQDSYAQGGFVIRDASSALHQQRWIMYNMGYQDNAVAREIKTTIPSANGTGDSLSTLNLNNIPNAANQGRLRVCRLGSVLRFYHRHPAENGWVEEVFRTTGTAPTRVNGNGPRPPRADNSALSFDRPDFAATLQVGLYVGNYTPPPAGVRGEFDYARYGSVSSVADCTKDL